MTEFKVKFYQINNTEISGEYSAVIYKVAKNIKAVS